MSKFQLLSSVAIGAIATAFVGVLPANAQPPAVHNWSGPYLGLNAGEAWGDSSANTPDGCDQSTGYYCDSYGGVPFGAVNGPPVSAAGSGTIADNGFSGGVQAGYNWQHNNLVYGVETDFGALKLKASRQGTGTFPQNRLAVSAGEPFTVTSSFNTNWLATLRGRFGVAMTPNLLAYVTGGLALTRLTVSNSYYDTSGKEYSSTSKLKAGPILGVGLEWALSTHWSILAQYEHLSFGRVKTTGKIVGSGYSQGLTTSSDLTGDIARIGINYKF